MAVDDHRKPPRPLRSQARPASTSWFALVVTIIGLMALGFMGAWDMVVGLSLFLFLGVYFVSPLIARPKGWVSANPDVRAIDLDEPESPEGIADAHRSVLEALAKLGFVERGWLVIEHNDAMSTYYLAIFDNRSERTIARWIVQVLPSPHKPREPILGFFTRFADGLEVATGNNPAVSPFPAAKFRKGFRFPGVVAPDRLLRLHHRALAEQGEFSTRVDLIEGDPIVFFRKSAAEEMGCRLKAGYYRLDEASARYRLTVLGAYLVIWKHFWPLGPLRRAYANRTSAQRLRDWEATTG